MRVRTYIVLLTSGSLIGALCIALFGWLTFSGLNEATDELEKEAQKSGISSDELSDVMAFLTTTRSIFITMEIYPENFSGVFSIAYDAITLAKEGANQLSDKYYENYPDEILIPISTAIRELEDSISEMQKVPPFQNDSDWATRNLLARKNYDSTREKLKNNLDDLEIKALGNLNKANQALSIKWQELEDREQTSRFSLIFVIIVYFILIIVLAFITYRSFARPISRLEEAATRSIEMNQPFNSPQIGPIEVKSLTRRLQGLIIGLESTVKKRTSALVKKTDELKLEITQRKELETQLVHAQKMEAVGQLASGIAHEINSPSQFANDNILFLKEAVEGFISKLTGSESAPDDKELSFLKENAPDAVQQAQEGISRITTIVKSMKNFAYRDAESAKKPNDLNQAIKSTIVVATNEWKYHADVVTNLDETLQMVPCNVGEINQVVLNLVVNGAHAIRDRFESKGKGEITITTKHYPSDDCVVISITDNGGGIPLKVQERIFEPFFTTKEVGVGTGQGLAIAHSVIVKSHNGQIWFQSVEGEGTTFYIKLPMTQT
ncbi:ATP-binding protein [Opitutales bacterium]|nr:ATP-binding protein [Opitutales bacterium]MDA8991491.1 ATP-binding protein [Opitutales bacterium]